MVEDEREIVEDVGHKVLPLLLLLLPSFWAVYLIGGREWTDFRLVKLSSREGFCEGSISLGIPDSAGGGLLEECDLCDVGDFCEDDALFSSVPTLAELTESSALRLECFLEEKIDSKSEDLFLWGFDISIAGAHQRIVVARYLAKIGII